MVELRKRKEGPPAPEKPAKKKAGPKSKKDAEKVEDTVEKAGNAVPSTAGGAGATAAGETNGAKSGGPPKTGDTITLKGFGGEVETQDGKPVTLMQLVDESKTGVVLFTYPKASTPGCTTQACAFRDGYSFLTNTGLSIYGLSSDGTKANTTFKNRQNLPYTLLCDPKHVLISAIGMSVQKKTKRGVFVVDKQGKVLGAQQGGPQPTVDAVKRVVDSMGKNGAAVAKKMEEGAKNGEDKEAAETAAEVADAAIAAGV